MTRMRAAFVAAAMAVVVPVGLRAQATGNPVTADQYMQRAQALHIDPAQYGVAAMLYQRSASMRAPGDPKAIEALEMAGRLFAYAGEPGRGRAAMERAAEMALQNGDVVTSANDYADAAFIAASQHSLRAADLARRVLWLADSSLLTEEKRNEIRGRLGPQVIATLRQHAGDVGA